MGIAATTITMEAASTMRHSPGGHATGFQLPRRSRIRMIRSGRGRYPTHTASDGRTPAGDPRIT